VLWGAPEHRLRGAIVRFDDDDDDDDGDDDDDDDDDDDGGGEWLRYLLRSW